MNFDLSRGGIITPSVMCANLLHLERDIRLMLDEGLEYLHIDFMDNKYVPNITFGTDVVAALAGVDKMKRDIHILARTPEQYFDAMKIGESDNVAVHFDACDDVGAVLGEIAARGAEPFLAISPDTPVEEMLNYLDLLSGVIIMSVYPGFAGRPMVPGSFERLKAAREIIDKSGREIVLMIDGNVSWQNAPIMRECGADMFVAGSSSIFDGKADLKSNIERFRELIK